MKEKGQSIAEFVVVSPFLFLLIFGIFQLGHIVLTFVMVNHAAFIVARVGVVYADDAGIRDSRMSLALRTAMPVKGDKYVKSYVMDNNLFVTVTYKLPLLFPVINMALVKAMHLPEYKIPISASCTMRLEA